MTKVCERRITTYEGSRSRQGTQIVQHVQQDWQTVRHSFQRWARVRNSQHNLHTIMHEHKPIPESINHKLTHQQSTLDGEPIQIHHQKLARHVGRIHHPNTNHSPSPRCVLQSWPKHWKWWAQCHQATCQRYIVSLTQNNNPEAITSWHGQLSKDFRELGNSWKRTCSTIRNHLKKRRISVARYWMRLDFIRWETYLTRITSTAWRNNSQVLYSRGKSFSKVTLERFWQRCTPLKRRKTHIERVIFSHLIRKLFTNPVPDCWFTLCI